jgi:hypothetical protein
LFQTFALNNLKQKIMKKLWTLLAFAATTMLGFAQDPIHEWGGLLSNRRITSSVPSITDLARDSSGNVYIVGNFSGNDTIDFDLGTGVNLQMSPTGQQVGYCAKYSSTLQLLWVQKLLTDNSGSASVSQVIVRPSQNVLIGGNFSGVFDFDPGVGVQNETSNGTDFYVLNLNGATGGYITHIPTIQAGEQTLSALKQDSKANIYFSYRSDAGGSRFEVVEKLGASGWVYYVSSTTPSGLQMKGFTVDTAGNVYFYGKYRNILFYNNNNTSQNISSPSAEQMIFIKISPTGGYLSYQQTPIFDGLAPDGAPYFGNFNDAITDVAGNLYIVGSVKYVSALGFSGALLPANDTVVSDGFVVKYNSSGTGLWAKRLFGNSSRGSMEKVSLDKKGNIFLSGFYRGDVDFDSIGNNILSRDAQLAPYLLKLTKEGKFAGVAQPNSARGIDGIFRVYENEIFCSGLSANDSADLNIGSAETIYKQEAPSNVQVAYLSKHSMPSCDNTVTVTATGLSANIADAASYEWINCANDSVIGTGKTIVLANGTRASVHIEKGFCSTQSACTLFDTTGVVNSIRNIDKLAVSVYPNPTNDVLNIEAESNEFTLTITDIAGRRMMTAENKKAISLSQLASGVYNIEIKTERGIARKQFIKD